VSELHIGLPDPAEIIADLSGRSMPVDVLVVGGGAREHAIAWAVHRSTRCGMLHTAPGNDDMPGERVDIAADDVDALVAFAVESDIDLVIVGPEVALAAGLVDAMTAAGIEAFGPTREAAQLEWDKAFTRQVAAELGLPSPAFASFASAELTDEAIAWWRALGRPIVVKQVGLAGGKGVAVPLDDESCEAAIRSFFMSGGVVLEERLHGPECSLLAFCDGMSAKALPFAQDHKRLGEGDTGPNTGGMGAYAPAPVPYDADELTAAFIQPVVDYMQLRGTPFVGVLYAGLMLTADGPKLLEFNCRFGDPEAQVLLPLLTSDLITVAQACCTGKLANTPVEVGPGAALGVVIAAPNYPGPGPALDPISAVDIVIAESEGTLVFRGTGGGREYTVVGVETTLAAARDAAYRMVADIAAPTARYRRDIGWRAHGASLDSYAAAGVDIDEGTRAVEQLKAGVERTHTTSVLGGIGAFGGTFDLSQIVTMDKPVLVASTDGVGTKVELAARAGRYDVPGQDIVNHCINDVLVQGARPLFFLDYFASSAIRAEQVAAVVNGMSTACAAAGCVLLGGETAEMPGVYMPGAFDVAGTLVGVVERDRLLPLDTIAPGDVLVGLLSSGPHTNGYSLLRKLFDWLPLDARPEPLDRSIGDALLVPHRSYLEALQRALVDHGLIKGLAHITGGGLIDNVPRVLPADCDASITLGSWPMPPLFRLVQEVATGMSQEELYRTLNMGIGMVIVVDADRVPELRERINEPSWVIGEVIAGGKHVRLV
jgi:phosphoribosylamine--glycine ligase/phosphoribosylaminoimidazole synthetase